MLMSVGKLQELEFLIPRDHHIKKIAENMRQADKHELFASGQRDVHEALIDSVVRSEACVVACLDDEPLVIYGMYENNILTNTAVIWMLGTDESLKYPREFMVYTKRVIKEMMIKYTELMNYVHAENKISIKWLQALGFAICDPIEVGPGKHLFHKFYKNRSM